MDEMTGLDRIPNVYVFVLMVKSIVLIASFKRPYLIKAAIYSESLQLALE